MHWRDFQALQKVAELDSRFMSFVEQGAGAPILLLHGIPTWGYLWDQLIPPLAKTRRVLVPDLLGFGFSDKSDRFDRSIRTQAEMLAIWMETAEIQPADVIGHDIGGGIALRLATLYPRLVKRLCLMDSVCYDSWPIGTMAQLGLPEVNTRFSASTMFGLLKQGMKQGFSASPDDELLEGLLAPYTTEVGKLSLIRNAASLNTNFTMEIVHLLPALQTSTLIIWGEDDSFQPVKYGERLAGDIPRAKLVRIENASHFVMLDQPDEVMNLVLSFFAG